ncbi:MAG: hypothetical protein ACREJC_06390, partial [Tepidisphaeraceae bacterium]
MSGLFRGALIVVVLGACVAPTNAVILYRSATRNTTAPTGEFANSGWQYEGIWGTFTGTPIAPKYLISAAHLGGSSTLTLNSVVYHVDTTWNSGAGTPGWIDDPNSDLRIWKIQETFPSSVIAPLYDDSVDGVDVGKTAVIYGRGTQRGGEVRPDTVTGSNGDPPGYPGQGGGPGPKTSELKGWLWGPLDGLMSWGTNITSGVYDAGMNYGELLYYDFNRVGLFDESALSDHDSGGGLFIKSGSTWK